MRKTSTGHWEIKGLDGLVNQSVPYPGHGRDSCRWASRSICGRRYNYIHIKDCGVDPAALDEELKVGFEVKSTLPTNWEGSLC